ncbi:MAG: RsmD family RNA methyltransferase [Opitutales bacterium]
MKTIETQARPRTPGHPWLQLSQLPELPDSVRDGEALGLVDSEGNFLGCGILDRNDEFAAWRRYTQADAVPFDEYYLTTALLEAVERRGNQSCQRLVSSDADYLPGLVVESYGDVLRLSLETVAMRAQVELIVELLGEFLSPVEIVLDAGQSPKTVSGHGLKGRWVEIDELLYRIDFLNTDKPRYFLEQREQHTLVGSLCEGRIVLDLFSHCGAFALQALWAGAERAIAVDLNDNYAKAIGANANRNELQVETASGDALDYLRNTEASGCDVIVLDPPSAFYAEGDVALELHRAAFASLPQGGLLATYCRDTSLPDFDSFVAGAAAVAGREARIFARTSQPFDFPMLLNFPQSQIIRGLILQVE